MIGSSIAFLDRARIAKRLPLLTAIASTLVFLVAIRYLHRELVAVSWTEVEANIKSHSFGRVILASCLAAAGYTTLTGYDALAMRYIRHPLPYARTALTAFMAFAVGHNVGVAAFSGGSIRFRMYTTLGLAANEILRVITFCSLTFAVGAGFLLGAALLAIPADEVAMFGLPNPLTRALGFLCIGLICAYVSAPLLRAEYLRVGSWRIEIPRLSTTVLQLLLSSLELSLAAGTLFVLLRPELDFGFLTFIGLYLVAVGAGILSSLPGGIGVFEAVMLIALPDVSREVLLSTLVVYRLIYYVAPLTIAIALLGLNEIRPRRAMITRIGQVTAEGLSHISPYVLSVLVFLAGAVLLVSGSLPAVDARMNAVGGYLPLAILESSHLAASVFGLCLLVLAYGLYRRLHRAYRLTLAVLIAGVVACLIRGLDYEEATLLGITAVMVWLAGDQFYRRGSLREQRFSARWVAAISMAIAGMIWIGLLSYRDVEYSSELFWRFSVDSNAPRMLRAAVTVTTLAIAVAVWRLMRPADPGPQQLKSRDVQDVRKIVTSAPDPTANAALIGDKRVLFSEDRTAFIMYAVHGRSWVAFGDPVGDPRGVEQLAWKYLELCDRHDGVPAFYQVTDARLTLYVDLGLSLWKLGEEARVNLAQFSLEGSARADLRQARNRADKSNAKFSVLSRAGVAAHMAELRSVSDSWLKRKSTAEKGFSLGAFSDNYVSHFDCAIVTIDDRIVAFANLWPAPAGRELSIDMMRYNDEAPKSIMDFLLVELILWARARDYQWFNLGMAPLAGLETHPLAPMWQKLGNAIFHHAEEYYNFEGLRAYKQKFDPVWRPRYLACPNGIAFPRVLYDTAILVAGKLRSVVSK